ncbi:hypothetical protein AB9E19_33750, partial [Rhizobium leguminosarum]|uniref:hypothetical protein n=1 Tax=Rhizobium leguminosarum TaxID=384 RepID=UPI003F9E23AC
KAEQPVRFKVKGHVALCPAAPNPFVIKTVLGKTRAMVALATRGAAASGSVSTIPLQAGPLNQTGMRSSSVLPDHSIAKLFPERSGPS